MTVNDGTSDGTAKAGTNYTAQSGHLTFADGVTSQTITVPVLGDHVITPYLNFMVTLTPGTGVLGSQTQELVTIFNEDGTPNQRYIEGVYLVLLEREADPDGLAFWSGELDAGEPRSVVSQQLTQSAEYFMVNIITPAYQQFLDRCLIQAASPIGLHSCKVG